MKKDEFNVEKITNEENGLSFEFGSTQEAEFTSYVDNHDNIRDEVNDNPTSNGPKRPKKENKRRKKEEPSKKETNQSQSVESSISSSTATISTIVGASLVSVVTLSTMVGINLFFNGKCNMNIVEPTTNSIFYELDLTDIKDDKCIIKLEYQSYSDSHELVEGPNSGEFIGLNASTQYHVSVIDITYNNYILFEDNVSTKEEIIPPIETYTVTFVTDGGSEIESQVVNSGDTVSRPDDPTKESYTFDGWYTDSDLTNEYDFETPVTSDLSLYAKWLANTYIVTFDTNGGSEVASQKITVGGLVSRPEDPTRDEYTFGGWFLDADLTEEYDFATPVKGDLTLYAKWVLKVYTVTFDSKGGSEVSEQAVNSGETVIRPDDPTRTDYYFGGWFSDPDFMEEYDFETPITSDITLYAAWEIYTYIVAFITNGGSEVPMQTVAIRDTAVRPEDPTKDDYTFVGWYKDSAFEEEYDFDTPVTEDVYLYAKWEELPEVTISFETNGGTGEMETDQQYLGKEYILPECTFTAPNGYVFDCWQISSGDSQYQPGEGYLIQTTTSVTFIAVWAEAATIEFYPGIGATGSVTSLKVAIGKEYKIPSGEEYFIPPTNQEFDYWFDDMYSEQRHTGEVITIEDTYYSFTAHWKYLDGLTFTVTFDSNGGSEVESQVVNAGTNATKPANPTKDGYNFVSWCSNSELTNSYNFLTPVTSDITLYAKWELATHTVTFDTNGGAEIASQEVTHGECAERPSNPIRGTYSFVGRDINTDSSEYYGYETDTGFSFDKYGANYMCNTTAIPGEIVSVSLYTFACQQTSITFNVGFGTAQLSGRSTAGGGSYVLAGGSDHTFDNTIEGATYFSISCNEYDNGGDTSMVACIDKIVVTYKLGTGDSTNTLTFDSFDDLPAGYTDSDPVTFSSSLGNYFLEGWFSDSELTEEYDFDTPVTEDITLYAKWSATYSVSGEGFNGFPNSTVGYATESEINGVNLQVSAYSCYYNDPDDGHGLWITFGSDSQSPESDFSSYLANKTPINGSIKSIAITVGPSAYGGNSNTTLHVTFGTEPMLEHLISGTTIIYDTDATLVVECNSDGFSYFNITNVSENGLVIESIVVTYYVN